MIFIRLVFSYKENNTLLLKEIADLKKLEIEFKNNQQKNKILKHEIEKTKLRITEIVQRFNLKNAGILKLL